jgi:hypothetical protein
MCIDNSALDDGLEIDAEILQVKLVSINELFNFMPPFFVLQKSKRRCY